MQGQRRPADAALGEGIEQGWREMEPRRRRCHSTLGAGKDRLVVGAVPWVAAPRALDIGRQRHRAVTRKRLTKRPGFEVETQGHVALGMFLGNGGGEVVAKDDAVADAQPACTPGESAPGSAEIAVQGHLDRGSPAAPNEPRRDHLGVVEDQEVARSQQCREIHDPPVLQSNPRSSGTPLTQPPVSLGSASPTLLNPLSPLEEREG